MQTPTFHQTSFDATEARKRLRERRLREQFFDASLFGEPAWDILLDLWVAHAEDRRVSVTSLCLAAAVPTTTALRWIDLMVREGFLSREADGEDKRRVFISLTEAAFEALRRYFHQIALKTSDNRI